MADGQICSFGPYQLDSRKEQLWCATQPVRLTPKAFQILSYLVARPGQLVTKDELFRVLWAETVVSDAALTTCIQEIRKALPDDARNPVYLETVHRRGFRFIAAVTAAPVPSAELQVPSQEIGGRRAEQATDEQEGSSVMPVQTGLPELQAQAAGDAPWIPASAGMPHSPLLPNLSRP